MREARATHAELVLFPELALTGYPPEDLLLKEHFLTDAADALLELAADAHGVIAVVGYPQRAEDVYNAAAVLAEYLEYQLNILGLPIYAAISAGAVTHLSRVVNKRDLVIAITFRRGLRQTIEGVQQARAHGAYCVGISDTYLSPLARECREMFLASVESTSFGISYAAPISLLDAIIAACGQYRRPLTMAVARQMAEEQRKGFRWYSA